MSGYSGIARSLRASAFARPSIARRAFQPIKTSLSPALGARFASDVREGKIHQVIGAVVDGRSNIPHPIMQKSYWPSLNLFCFFATNLKLKFAPLVKFESEQLPPILNALETENAGQKLVLEVAVRLILQDI